MEKLISLVQIISKSKVKNIEIVTERGEATLLSRFYYGIADGSIRTHNDIQMKLYKKAVDMNVINKIKENLYKRLINTAFFIDTKQLAFTDYQKAFFYVHKQYSAFIILSNKGLDKKAIIEIGEFLLRKSLEFDFTEIVIGVKRILSINYALNGDVKKRERIKNILLEQLEMLELEIKARNYHYDIIQEYVQHRGANKELSQKATSFYIELKPFIKIYPTYSIVWNIYMLGIFSYGLVNDYTNSLKVCNEAIAFFDAKKGNYNFVTSIYIEKLNCCIYFKLYEEGLDIYKKILPYTQEGTHNWFKVRESVIKLLLYSQKYDEAYTFLVETMDSSKFKGLLGNYREYWKVCEVYIFILMQLEKLKRIEVNGKAKNFRLSAFVNDVPTFSTDKRGMNIPVIIAQILYFIIKKDYEMVDQRMSAIEQYCTRNLIDKDFDGRSYYFIKMLLTMQECGYNKKRVMFRIERFKSKFEEIPEESKNLEIEIMPYEDILDIVFLLIE